MVKKLYYSMGEVTEMFDVEPSLIRYWCSQFTCLRPKRNAKGNRMFTPQDVERLKRIYHLLKEKKMTIEGAQKAMRKRNIEAVENDSEIALLEQLQRVRAMLVEMRNGIGDESYIEDESATDADDSADVETSIVSVAEKPAVVEIDAEQQVPIMVAEEAKEATLEEPVAEQETVVEVAEVKELAVEEVPAAQPKKKRATRRKSKGEDGVVERPLFPFFEQTLF